MGSVMDRNISALEKRCHNVIRGPVVSSNCWAFAERTVAVVCGILHRMIFEMAADQIPSTEGDPKFTPLILLLYHNILVVKYVFKRVSERLIFNFML
jgi:hypothetical protein